MKVRLGILGLGRIAERFSKMAIKAEGLELAAVAARDKGRADDFARRFGVPRAYGSYEELVSDPGIDAVYVATTHNFHPRDVRLCLEAGKAVLCEKPFVTTKREAEDLAALAASKRLLLMEAMWTRCMPAFRKTKEWVDSGAIGDIRLIEAEFCFKAPYDPRDRLFNPELAGGALFDAGVYPIEFATGIAGEGPSSISGSAVIGKTGVDEFASISLGFPRGIVASLACGFTARVPKDARIYGDSGSIKVYDFLGSRRCERLDPDGTLVESFENDFEDGFIFEIEHFAALFKEGKKESPFIPLRDTIDCASIFDTLRRQWGLR